MVVQSLNQPLLSVSNVNPWILVCWENGREEHYFETGMMTVS